MEAKSAALLIFSFRSTKYRSLYGSNRSYYSKEHLQLHLLSGELAAFWFSLMETRATHKYIIMQLVDSNKIVTCSRTAMREEAILFL